MAKQSAFATLFNVCRGTSSVANAVQEVIEMLLIATGSWQITDLLPLHVEDAVPCVQELQGALVTCLERDTKGTSARSHGRSTNPSHVIIWLLNSKVTSMVSGSFLGIIPKR
ncbi:MAG: hypothetical protein U5K37_05255 [Natrialbaceae archaeon]|nr:hypothetical protein [Natrialbaceae archaeon]